MRPGKRSGGAGRPDRRGELARVGAVFALLVIAAMGTAARAHARVPISGLLGPAVNPAVKWLGIGMLAAACAAMAAMIAVLVRRIRRHRDDEEPDSLVAPADTRLLRFLAFMIVLAALALPTAGLVALARRHASRTGSVSPVLPGLPRLAGHAAQHTPDAAVFAAVLAATLTLLAAGGLVIARARHRAAAVRPGRSPDEPLAAAVTAGRRALQAAGDARAAIIACYVAMEDALAEAGSPRQAADTPEELLRRAAGSGIVRTPGAQRLTTMFLLARFSRHPVTEDQRRAAQSALDDITADLGGRP